MNKITKLHFHLDEWHAIGLRRYAAAVKKAPYEIIIRALICYWAKQDSPEASQAISDFCKLGESSRFRLLKEKRQ